MRQKITSEIIIMLLKIKEYHIEGNKYMWQRSKVIWKK